MTPSRFKKIAANYPKLRIAVIGDVCLDRYLEIDSDRPEISIETDLPVFNVTNVRSQPGAAGTIINNLVALGVGEIIPVAFNGEDGEGWELRRALGARAGVSLKHVHQTDLRRTFTYTKPLMMPSTVPPKIIKASRGKGGPGARVPKQPVPRELNRLDFKNWSPTPASLEDTLIKSVRSLARTVDAFILLDQVDIPNTGVLTTRLLAAIGEIAASKPGLLILADSRRGFRHFPPVGFKMNGAELARAVSLPSEAEPDWIQTQAASIAAQTGRHVFVTLAERGIIGADAKGSKAHVDSLPLRGPIDIVGAGDSVTANLTTALLGGATLRESLEIANVAASIVIHQVGTTGTASPNEIADLL